MDGWTDLLIRRHILILVHKERKYKDRKKNIYIYNKYIYQEKRFADSICDLGRNLLCLNNYLLLMYSLLKMS